MATVTEFDSLHEALRSAGSVLMDFFGKQLERTFKTGSADFRTQADLAAEEILIRAVEESFPDYNILAEERGTIDKGSPYTFVIDPLDGTHNFVLGIPAFVSNVALMKDGETIYGVVHHPVTGDTYHASLGDGAFRNGACIRVGDESERSNLRVSYYCNYTTPKVRAAQFKSTLLRLGIQRSLDLWSPGFCFCSLACGRLEAVINDGTELYDYAAGRLIALEAGAKLTDFLGDGKVEEDNETFLLSNSISTHQFLLENVTRPLAAK